MLVEPIRFEKQNRRENNAVVAINVISYYNPPTNTIIRIIHLYFCARIDARISKYKRTLMKIHIYLVGKKERMPFYS